MQAQSNGNEEFDGSNPPEVSVILVTWNSRDTLSQCLEDLSRQVFKGYELIIVDNGSGDTAGLNLNELSRIFDLRIERLTSNLGFAAANNIGARLARGKWLALLNADAFPEPDWLESLLRAARQNPDCTAFSSRQIQYHSPGLLDGAGDAYHISGLAWRNGHNLPADKYGLEQKEIFSPCAAAALYSREEFLNLGGFDEDYFSYFEDVDLGFRLRLDGGKCLYVPEAVVRHVGSASTGKRSDFSVYYGYRNMIWTFFKDMPSPYFWLFLPLHGFAVLFFVMYLALRGQSRAILRAVFDAVLRLPEILSKRRLIQRDIKASPRDLLRVMSNGLFEPVQEFLKRNRRA
ncbi:MAG: glycosyltransferase family 2 protein [Chloroflexi bacterium]|nr:glycosyltransferase family 2 protein [Chloroflexota bacterium]MDL1944208.1 glycosyltransferase family 2 protein [Chloroflexi bacterium CFX2]